MKCDVVIVGAGPAGIFTALEMIRQGSSKKIVIIEYIDMTVFSVGLKLMMTVLEL